MVLILQLKHQQRVHLISLFLIMSAEQLFCKAEQVLCF